VAEGRRDREEEALSVTAKADEPVCPACGGSGLAVATPGGVAGFGVRDLLGMWEEFGAEPAFISSLSHLCLVDCPDCGGKQTVPLASPLPGPDHPRSKS
jgi:hypothetical protein